MNQIHECERPTLLSGCSASGRFSFAERLHKRLAAALLMALICVVPALAEIITVSGTVVDETGEPLIGAAVVDKDNKTVGCNTDIDGNFVLKVDSKATLLVSYVGYDPMEVPVNGRTNIQIKMETNATMLQEVVAVGYGTVKKNDLTGAVSSVDTKKLNAKGAPSVLANLQGSTPGVTITQSSGRTNGGFNIEIRGKSSINSSTTPLYVVDGVMCSDIDFLNPQDIDRIDVLKDASSTAIYGSRATAGVILITTKGGRNVNKEQKASITYDGYYGINQIARMPDFMDGEEFYRYRFLKFTKPVGDLKAPAPSYSIGNQLNLGQALLQKTASDYNSEFVLKEMLASNSTTDWPSLVTQNGHQQNHYLAVSGASETANYHFGLGINQEDGIYIGDKANTFSFKGSVDARINKVINAGFNINLARIDKDYAYDNAIAQAYRVNPFMKPYDENGNTYHKPGHASVFGTDANQFSDFLNPLDRLNNYTHKRRTYRALGNVYLQLNLMKGLNVKTTFSPSYSSYRDGAHTGYKNPNNADGLTWEDDKLENSSTTVVNYTSIGYTWDNTINYVTTIADKHNINALALFSMENSNNESYTMAYTGVQENTDWWNLATGTPNADSSKSSYSEGSMISYALRANYDYMGKYFFTGTVRWDGSSKFARGKRWGSFPSAAVAWRISQENFLQNVRWINNLKLRLSYGVTGNNKGIGNYASIVGIGGPVNYPFDGTWISGQYPGGIADLNLCWEKSYEWNLGLDFGFLNSRISGSVDVYKKTSKDLLYSVELPLEAGGTSMTTNVGSVDNKGIEFSLTTVNVTSKAFEWTTTLNLSHNKNKIKEINGVGNSANITSITGALFVGQPYNSVYTWAWDGIVNDKNMTVPNHQIAIDKGFTPGQQVISRDYYYACYGLTEGQPIIRDVDGNGTWDDNDKVISDSDPDLIGSFTSNMTFNLPKKAGSIDFSFNIYARLGGKLYSPFLNGDYYDYHDRGRGKMNMDYYIPAGALIDCDGMNPDGTYINPVYQTQTHYGSWPFPNVGTNDGYGPASSYFPSARAVTSATFAKVKNITVGYTFNKSILKHIGCQDARVYFNVLNPFVFTKYKGFDPEWAGASLKNDGPSTISYQIGASIRF